MFIVHHILNYVKHFLQPDEPPKTHTVLVNAWTGRGQRFFVMEVA